MDVRRRIPDTAKEAPTGPVLAGWLRDRGEEPGRRQEAETAPECPLCGEELVFSYASIPGASPEVRLVAECARHGRVDVQV